MKARFPSRFTLKFKPRPLLYTTIWCGTFEAVRRRTPDPLRRRYRIIFLMGLIIHRKGGNRKEHWRRSTSLPCGFQGYLGFLSFNGPTDVSFMPHSSSNITSSNSSYLSTKMCLYWKLFPLKQQFSSSSNIRLTRNLHIPTFISLWLFNFLCQLGGWNDWRTQFWSKYLSSTEKWSCFSGSDEVFQSVLALKWVLKHIPRGSEVSNDYEWRWISIVKEFFDQKDSKSNGTGFGRYTSLLRLLFQYFKSSITTLNYPERRAFLDVWLLSLMRNSTSTAITGSFSTFLQPVVSYFSPVPVLLLSSGTINIHFAWNCPFSVTFKSSLFIRRKPFSSVPSLIYSWDKWRLGGTHSARI